MPFAHPADPLPAGSAAPAVFVVMERWVVDDDGNSDFDLEAVHVTRQGAEGNLTPTDSSGLRERFIIEVELQP